MHPEEEGWDTCVRLRHDTSCQRGMTHDSRDMTNSHNCTRHDANDVQTGSISFCRKWIHSGINPSCKRKTSLHNRLNYSVINMAMLQWVAAIFFVISTCLSSHVIAVDWDPDNLPEDTKVNLGGYAFFKCGVLNSNVTNFIWKDSGDNTLFLDDLRINAPPNMNVTATGQGNNLGYTLNIFNAGKDDNLGYICEVTGKAEKKSAQLTVLVAPEDPQLTLNKSAGLVEDDVIVFTCSSEEGNPPPDIKWYREGVSVTDGITEVPPTNPFETTSSLLQRTLTKDDNDATFKCEVENEVNQGHPKVTSKQLEVKYAPHIEMGPANPYIVEESKPANLTCTADANPSDTTMEWHKDGNLMGSNSYLTIGSTTKANSGVYECHATNEVGTRSDFMTLDVQYGPHIDFKYTKSDSTGARTGSDVTIIVKEGEGLNMTCTVTANPAVSDNDIKWYEEGIGEIGQGETYSIAKIKRDDDGRYYCQASNTLTPTEGQPVVKTGRVDITINVQYIPGIATITADREHIEEGQDVELTCKLDDNGNPGANLHWTKAGYQTIIHTGEIYNLYSLTFTHITNYTCSPVNSVGPGTPGTYILDVKEQPQWLDPRLTPDMAVTINHTGLTVKCHVSGRPAPDIRWEKDGQLLDVSDGLFQIDDHVTMLDQYISNSTSVLHWKGPNRDNNGLRVEDSGNYSCITQNDVSPAPLESQLQLIVQYPPEVATPSDRVATDTNTSVTLTCQAHSQPGTTFHWYNGTEKLNSNSRVHISNIVTGGDYPYQTFLNLTNVQYVDLADYTCVGTNPIGSNSQVIHLTVKTVPEAPSNLSLISKTWESAELSWTGQFDGGYQQDFIVKYSALNSPSGNIFVGADNKYNVTELYPSDLYTFIVYANNTLGTSAYSNSVTMETDEFVIDPPTNVNYDPKTRTLEFDSPSSYYCARVDIHDGNDWKNYEPCAPTEGGSIKIDDEEEVDSIQVALCLESRTEICSENVTAGIVEEDLPVHVIIIVACVCGAIVVILSIVLAILCCRRRKDQKKYKDAKGNVEEAVVNPTRTAGYPLKPAIKGEGLDNPGLDQIDLDDPTTGGVFATDTSSKPPGGGYGDKRAPNGHTNGYLWNDYAPDQQGAPPTYDNMYNSQREKNQKDPKSNKYPETFAEENSKEGSHSSGDSGVAALAQHKPKKVIYEVIV